MSCRAASIAVIIPTKNRPDDLDATIVSLFDQSVLPSHLIIVDQSTNDESQGRVTTRYEQLSDELRSWLKLSYVHDMSINGLTEARNRALELVDAEIVLFLDDDVILEHDFNDRILEAYGDYPEAAGISGIISNYQPPSRPFRWWSSIFVRGPFHDDRQPIYWRANRLRQSSAIKVSKLGGGLMSFRIAAIKIARFDENLHGACDGEDIDFCAQLWPKPLFIAPKARLMHKRSPTGRDREHWLAKYARTNWYLYRRHWNFGFRNRLYFLWINLGCALAATLGSFNNWSLDSWTGLFKGIHDSRLCASKADDKEQLNWHFNR